MVLVPANVTSHPAGVVPFVTMTAARVRRCRRLQGVEPAAGSPTADRNVARRAEGGLLSPLAVVTTVVVLASKSAVP